MKNLPVIEIALETHEMSVPELISAGSLVKTSANPNTSAPPVTDANFATQVNKLQTIYNGAHTVPPTYTTDQVTTQRNIVVTAYNKIAGYVKGVANDVAIAAGDVTAGNFVVTNTGFKLKKAKTTTSKHFKATSTIAVTLSENIYGLDADISINNLTSGAIYGFREAIVINPPRKKVVAATTAATARGITPAVSTKAHKASYSDGATSHYVWSDWIYEVVK